MSKFPTPPPEGPKPSPPPPPPQRSTDFERGLRRGGSIMREELELCLHEETRKRIKSFHREIAVVTAVVSFIVGSAVGAAVTAVFLLWDL